jgi:putative ABC transport system permease protein
VGALLRDLRFALRQLLRSPGFTAAAVLTLALGIGVTAALFSVMNGVLLRSLPFERPAELVSVYTVYPDDATRYALSPPDFMSVREESRAFSGVAGFTGGTAILTGFGDPTELQAAWVTADFFGLLGGRAGEGRLFSADENQPGNTSVAVLTHAAWLARFGKDPEVLGRTVELNGISRTIVGVLEPGFDHPAGSEVYLPLEFGSTFSAATAEGRRGEWLNAIGRLRPGTTHEAAARDLAALTERLREAFPATNAIVGVGAVPLREELLGDVRTPFLVLMGAVALVLLIACGNVANLLLARASGRRGELAVRAAMGAARRRLVRQMLTESVVLWAAGGVAALVLGALMMQGILYLAPEGIPRLAEVRLDTATVAVTAAAVLLTGVAFGLVPALQATRGDLAGSLRGGSRAASDDRGSGRLRGALVVGEVALALCLLVGAGLLLRSFTRLTAVDPGFRSEQVLSVRLAPPTARYADGDALRGFYGELLPRLESVPGVASVAAVSVLPLSGSGAIYGFSIVGREPPPEGQVQDMYARVVTPGYFSTLGIPLLRGRAFTATDREDSPPVMLINEAAAERFFRGADPVGERISLGGDVAWETVGVVGAVHQEALAVAPAPELYRVHAQAPGRQMNVVMRTERDPAALFGAVRTEVQRLDPALPMERFQTGDELVAAALARPRFYASLLGLFAASALVLAAVGISGLIAYAVGRRRREIGIRMALGADATRVVGGVMRGALALAGAGLIAGALLALAGTRLLSGLLYGVGTLDPVAFAAAAAALLAVAAAAAWLPARRAARVDPMLSIRAD